MKKLIVLVMSFTTFSNIAYSQEALEQWAHNHGKAKEALGAWVKEHTATARVLFEWDGKHPDYVKELVTWSIEHKGSTMAGFIDKHPNYRGSDIFGKHHAVAMEDFVHWCKSNPEAAQALVANDRGLLWVGNNLYREYLDKEEPRRR